MRLGRVTDRIGAMNVEQVPQQRPLVEAGAADQEVIGRPLPPIILAPGLAQPVAVGLKAPGGQYASSGLNALPLDVGRDKAPTDKFDSVYRRVITHLHTQALGAAEIGIHQGLAAAHEKSVGPRQTQCARQGRLEMHAVATHPGPASGRVADHQPGQGFGGTPACDLEQVLPELLLRVGLLQHILWRIVHAPQVAGVRRITATPIPRRRLQQQHAGARLARHQRGAQGSVTTADHQNIDLHIRAHAHLPRHNPTQSGLMLARLTISLQIRCWSLTKAAYSDDGPPPPIALSVAKRSVTELARSAL